MNYVEKEKGSYLHCLETNENIRRTDPIDIIVGDLVLAKDSWVLGPDGIHPVLILETSCEKQGFFFIGYDLTTNKKCNLDGYTRIFLLQREKG